MHSGSLAMRRAASGSPRVRRRSGGPRARSLASGERHRRGGVGRRPGASPSGRGAPAYQGYGSGIGSPDCAGGTAGARRTGRRPRLLVNMSTAMRPTPTQIAMSATLNVGQWCSSPTCGVDEVDDVPVADAIEHVAERAAEDERKPPLERALARLQAPVERHDERDRGDRDEQEERPPHVLARRLEQAPRAAAVLREDEREVVLPDLDDARIAVEPVLGPRLGADVGRERDERDEREEHVGGRRPAVVGDDPRRPVGTPSRSPGTRRRGRRRQRRRRCRLDGRRRLERSARPTAGSSGESSRRDRFGGVVQGEVVAI